MAARDRCDWSDLLRLPRFDTLFPDPAPLYVQPTQGTPWLDSWPTAGQAERARKATAEAAFEQLVQALLTWHRPVSFSSGGYHLGRTVASLFGEHAGGGAAGAAAQAPGGDGPVDRSNHADRMDDEPDFPPPVIALGPSWSESDFLTTDQLVNEIAKTRALLKSLGIGGEETAADVAASDDPDLTLADDGDSDQRAQTAALPAAPISVTATTEADLPIPGLLPDDMTAANSLPADLVRPASDTPPAPAGDFTVNENFVNGTNVLTDFREPANGAADDAEEPWSNPMGDPSGQGVPDYASMPPYVSSTSYGEQMAQLGAGAEDLAIGVGKGIVNGVPNLVFDAGKGWAYAGAAAWDTGRYALGARYDGFAKLWDTYGALSPLNADILDYNDRLQQAGGVVGGLLSPAAYGKAISVLGSASSGGAAFLRGLGVPDFKIGLPAYNPSVLYSNPIPLALAAVDPLAEASSEIKAVGDALQKSAVAGAASGADQIAEGAVRAEDAVGATPNEVTDLVGTEPGAANRGLIFVSENLGEPSEGQMAARDFEAGTEGAYGDIKTRRRQVPALRYTNPNPNGAPYVKFDGFRQLDDGTIELIDSKTRIVPYATVDGPVITESVAEGLTRQSAALAQNPGYVGILEFPTQAVADEAKVVLKQLNIKNIGIRVRAE